MLRRSVCYLPTTTTSSCATATIATTTSISKLSTSLLRASSSNNSNKLSLAGLQRETELATLWGSSNLGSSYVSSETALPFLARLGHDPVLAQLVEPTTITSTQEDGLGTDLLSADEKHKAQSQSLWKRERGVQFAAALRRARSRGGASSAVGIARMSSATAAQLEDEADRADTTWARDPTFSEIADVVSSITSSSSSFGNMENLLTSIKKATPEQLVQIYSTRGLQPYSFLPIPCDAGWAFPASASSSEAGEGEEQQEGENNKSELLTEWCKNIQQARMESDQFVDSCLRSAIASSGWKSTAEKIADQLKKVHAVFADRRKRQLSGKEVDWWNNNNNNSQEKEKLCLNETLRQISSEKNGEFDAAGEDDSSEEFLVEHEKIEQLLDENLGDDGENSLTLRKFWMHCGERFENLQLQHLSHYNPQLRSACLLRARNELGGPAALDADIEKSIRESTFDSRGGFVVPAFTRGWLMLNFFKFGAAGSVVQHTQSSSRLLTNRFQTLEGCQAVAKLYYRLGFSPLLSSDIDLSSPFKHRKSLVAAVADFYTDLEVAAQSCNNTALSALDAKKKAMSKLVVDLISPPLGAARREAFENKRKLLTQNDVKIESVSVLSKNNKQWQMGSVEEVSFSWETPLLFSSTSSTSSSSSSSSGTRKMKKNSPSCCLTVGLFRKKSKQQIEESKKEMEEKLNLLQKEYLNNNNGAEGLEKKRVFDHCLKQIYRVSQPTMTSEEDQEEDVIANDFSACVEKWKKEYQQEESSWEFVTMLDDDPVIYRLIQDQTQQQQQQQQQQNAMVKVRLPFLSSSSSSPSSKTEEEYRLEIRAFDLQANPSKLPTRFTSATSNSFKIENNVEKIIQKVVGGGGSSSKTFPGHQLVSVCSALRKQAKIDIPVMLEFEVGQRLTLKGEVVVQELVDLLSGVKGTFFSAQQQSGLTQVQLACEAAVRRHYGLHHPGLTEREWAESRRAVMDHAMTSEFEWWRQDSVLQLAPEFLSPVASPSASVTSSGMTVCQGNADATLRYGRDVVQVLHATGRDGAFQNDDASPAVATVSLRGDGSTVGLEINQETVNEQKLSLKQILFAVKTANNSAHARLNTLAQAKLGLTKEVVDRFWLDNADSTDLGGFYAPTVVKSFERAQRDLGKLGFIPEKGEEAAAQEIDERSFTTKKSDLEGGQVDRFPSKENQELRRRVFSERTGSMGENADETPPEHLDPWN